MRLLVKAREEPDLYGRSKFVLTYRDNAGEYDQVITCLSEGERSATIEIIEAEMAFASSVPGVDAHRNSND